MKCKVYSEHVLGASHLAKGETCEDYALSHADDGCAIIIVSDGHGDKRSFRAADGARMACEGTMGILKQYIGKTEDVLKKLEVSKGKFFSDLQGLVLNTWFEKVAADFSARKFSDDELGALKDKDREYYQGNEKRHAKAYGCTLIAAFVAPSFWFCLQIGDGKCTVCYEGGTWANPLPEGQGQLLNITNSLCQTDAIEKFVHFFEKKSPLGVFVATDGVDESFPPLETSLKLAHFYREISGPFFKGEQDAQEALKGRLGRLTKEGSGDDVSVAAAICAETPLAEPKFLRSQLEAALEEVVMKIEGKRSSLRNNANALRQAEEELRTGEDRLSELKAEIERTKKIKADNEAELSAMQKNKEDIEFQLSEMV